jgi:tetratricopeptide (TPR) repeat protein
VRYNKPETKHRIGLWRVTLVGALILAGLAVPVRAQDRSEVQLLQDAKLLIFDAQWAPALDKLDELLDLKPKEGLRNQALFYRAECLSKLGREGEAIRAYRDYLKTDDSNKSLVEEAEGSLIGLYYDRYTQGDKDAIKEVEARLNSPSRAVKYYAAITLSNCRDKAIASKAVPILEHIIRAETDRNLTDRARIALLRVSPKSLKGLDRHEEDHRPRMLRLQIISKGQSKVDLAIPFALADLALQAVSEKDKAALRRKGYDLDRILSDLERHGGSVLEIRDNEEDTVFRIWIDVK